MQLKTGTATSRTFAGGTVFAFAVTLLVVSLEVPHTFSELLTTMRGFLAFGTPAGMMAHMVGGYSRK